MAFIEYLIMSSLNDREVKALRNETLSSSKPTSTDTTYAIYAMLNATIDPLTETNLLNFSSNDIFNQYNNHSNGTIQNDELLKRDHVFDRTDVRVIFTIIYTLVFCCCFFGNLLVILVVTMSRRLRSITNFFLANLAVADLCVGVFCVIQTLTFYLIDSWVFGEFLCKMYQFVHALSYTASIFILMIICMERYFAIIYPITCKQILTPTRLRLVIVGVWVTSALYSIPKFIFSRTVTNIHLNGISEEICIMHRGLFSSKLLDSINLSALYLLPLLVMTILYSRIAVALWRSSQGIERNIAMHHTPAENHGNAQTSQNAASNRTTTKYEKRPVGPTESQVSVDSDKITTTTWRTQSFHHHRHCHSQHSGHSHHPSHSSNNVLRARRGVVRMLIIVVLTFAICNLPLHARKLWQYMSINYHGESNFSALLTPITFLISYFNSAFNPLLYAFLSRNFRKGMREIILCSFKKNNKKTQQRIPLHVSKSVF